MKRRVFVGGGKGDGWLMGYQPRGSQLLGTRLRSTYVLSKKAPI